VNDIDKVLYDELKGLRGEFTHDRNERAKLEQRVTIMETEAGYVRKAVIGIIALLVIPVGKALAMLISSIKV
jgi:hypothetical protein